MPSGFVRTRRSPGFAPPLRRSRPGWAAPITARPYFGSASRIVWPPARVPPASRTLADAPAKISVSVSPGRSSGNAAIESAKRTRPPIAKTSDNAFAAAISPKVRGSSTSGGKKSTVPIDRQLVADTVDSAVVGRVQSGDKVVRAVDGSLGAETDEGLGEQVGSELRRTPAAVGHFGQPEACRFGGGHAWMIGRRAGTASWARYHPRWERSGPGGSPGLQNQWRGARRGAVGSTPTRSRHGRGHATEELRRRTRPAHGGSMPTERSRPPSVERLLAAARPLVAEGTDRAALTSVARDVVADERSRLAGDHREGEAERKGRTESEGAVVGQVGRSVEALAREVADRLDAFADPPAAGTGLTQVINATGVILHTNLGRAPWARAAIEAATRAAGGYSLLEFDRDAGRRGPRFRAAEEHLIALTGAQDALVTVNNAAALALAVGLAGRRGVAVSRGELVEIGGGVRIPEIVRRTGARLIEVGTTNRTRASDFEAPLVEGRASVVLRVHPSNFAQTGFVEAPDPIELARLAHTHGAILVDDVGSGALLETAAFGLAHEPTPAERLAAGADLVTFSGDKLVGGPQAGLIVGRADSSAASAATRWPVPCGPTRSPLPRFPRLSVCIGLGGRPPRSRSGR